MTGKNEDERWKQHLGSFGDALLQLEDACNQDEYSNLEIAGLVSTFSFTFEQGWKALKYVLSIEGIVAKSPRESIRKGFEAQYLDEDNCEILLDALEKRNNMSHMYDAVQAAEMEKLVKEHYLPVLQDLLSALEQHDKY